MERLTENKVVLVVRETRLEELKSRFNTVGQARFYVQQQGGNFEDYEQEDSVYHIAVKQAQTALGHLGRIQVVRRSFLPNFIFGADDVVVAVGQDGLVANTLKYLNGQPLIGINPDPNRYDGQLLPFLVKDLVKIVPEVFSGTRPLKSVTMAKAALNNGQTIYAVNDLFIGPKSHGSARYLIRLGGQSESQSSSGVIVSTGMGSTGWFSSLITGARGVSTLFASAAVERRTRAGLSKEVNQVVGGAVRFPWDANHLFFTVREPFPSKTTGVNLVFGRISLENALKIESFMPERGVIFSDGIESDFLEFNSGTKVEINIAERKGHLVS